MSQYNILPLALGTDYYVLAKQSGLLIPPLRLGDATASILQVQVLSGASLKTTRTYIDVDHSSQGVTTNMSPLSGTFGIPVGAASQVVTILEVPWSGVFGVTSGDVLQDVTTHVAFSLSVGIPADGSMQSQETLSAKTGIHYHQEVQSLGQLQTLLLSHITYARLVVVDNTLQIFVLSAPSHTLNRAVMPGSVVGGHLLEGADVVATRLVICRDSVQVVALQSGRCINLWGLTPGDTSQDVITSEGEFIHCLTIHLEDLAQEVLTSSVNASVMRGLIPGTSIQGVVTSSSGIALILTQNSGSLTQEMVILGAKIMEMGVIPHITITPRTVFSIMAQPVSPIAVTFSIGE